MLMLMGTGNVKVAGMPEDIHASASEFSTAVSIMVSHEESSYNIDRPGG